MAIIQPVQGPTPTERTQNVGANSLDEARAAASAQSRKGEVSALRPDTADLTSQPVRTIPFRQASSPSAAGTPAESGGKGAIVSVVV